MDAMLSSTPESYRPLVKRSLALYFKSFKGNIILALITAIIVFIPRLISDAIGQDVFLNVDPLNPNRLWLVPVNIAAMLFFIGIVWHTYCTLRNLHEPLMQDFMVGVKKILSVFFASILQSLLMFGVAAIIFGLQIILFKHQMLFPQNMVGLIFSTIMFTAQFFLILYMATLFIFLVPLIVIENKGIIKSIENSVILVWNHWWRVFSLQMTPWLYYVLLLFILRMTFGIDLHIYFTEYGAHTIAATLLHIVLFALFIPWFAAVLIVQLRDLELRKTLVKA